MSAKARKKLSKNFLTVVPAALSITFMLIAVCWVHFEYKRFQGKIAALEAAHMETLRQAAKRDVDTVFDHAVFRIAQTATLLGDSFEGRMLRDETEEGVKQDIAAWLQESSALKKGPARLFMGTYWGDELAGSFFPERREENPWTEIGAGGDELLAGMVAVAKERPGGGFFSYRWEKRDAAWTIVPKLVYLRGVPGWGVLIGAEICLAEVGRTVRSAREMEERAFYFTVSKVIFLLSGLMLLNLLLILAAGRRMSGAMGEFLSSAKRAVETGEAVAEEEIRHAEFSSLALAVNRGIEERGLLEKRLSESEKKLPQLLDRVPHLAIQKVGADLRIRYWNARSEELFGYGASEALDQEVVALLVPEERRPEVTEKLAGAMESAEMPEGFEMPLLLKTGDTVPVFWQWAVVKDSRGENELYLMARNLTGRNMAESWREEVLAQRVAVRKSEEVRLMARGVAHNLNNLLGGVVNYPEMLLIDLPMGHYLEKPLTTILRSGRQAAAVVSDQGVIARGKVSVREALSLNEAIERYVASDAFRKLLRRHPSRKLVKALGEGVTGIRCSPVHLNRVLVNLLENGLKNTGEKEARIIISTENHLLEELSGEGREPGAYVVLTVSDNGPPLSAEEREKVFEPFYLTRVMKRTGTGLEMALVWHMAEDHGGHIAVRSDAAGNAFELWLPAARGDEAPKGAPPLPAAYCGSGERILVADYDDGRRERICRFLEELGYGVKAVSSGEDAVDYLKFHTADLLLLDMVMGHGIGGRVTYERIVSELPGQKAVVMSGSANLTELRKVQIMGAGGFLKSPFSLRKMATVVRRELDK